MKSDNPSSTFCLYEKLQKICNDFAHSNLTGNMNVFTFSIKVLCRIDYFSKMIRKRYVLKVENTAGMEVSAKWAKL